MISLDIGNVLCDVDFSELIKELGDGWDIKPDEVWRFLTRIQHSQDLGHTNIREELNQWFHIDIKDNPHVIEAWNVSISPNPISIKHFEDIIDCFDVAILSNMGYDHRDIIHQKIGPKFKKCKSFISCEVGAAKPSRKYYEKFLAQHPEFNGSVYIDDRPENIRMGNYLGFDSVVIDTSKMSHHDVDAIWLQVKERLSSK